MKSISSRLALALITGLVSLNVYADTAFTVNGKPISTEEFNFLVEQLQAQAGPKVPKTEIQESAKQQLIRAKLVETAATAAGTAKSPDYIKERAKLETWHRVTLIFDRQNLLGSAYTQEWIRKNPVSPEEQKQEAERYAATPDGVKSKQAYDKKTKTYVGQKEYHIRHIVVKNEAEGKKIIEQLNSNGDFDKLARQHSLDNASAASGGDLGWNPSGVWEKSLADAVAKLSPGAVIKTPVKTQYGFHVIQLIEASRTYKPAPYVAYLSTADEFKRLVQGKKWNDYVEDLRKKAVIK